MREIILKFIGPKKKYLKIFNKKSEFLVETRKFKTNLCFVKLKEAAEGRDTRSQAIFLI